MGIFEASASLKTLLDQHIKATYFVLYGAPISCQTNHSFRLIFHPISRVSLMAEPARKTRPSMVPSRSRSSKASMRFANDRACISVTPMMAQASTIWSTRWWTTPSTKRWQDLPPKSQ